MIITMNLPPADAERPQASRFTLRLSALLLAFAALFYSDASARAEAPAVREVIVVFKTHFDIGYTDMASNVVRRYRTEMMDKALECVAASSRLPAEQQFVWTVPGWPMHKILEPWPGQDPGRTTKVQAALRQGRFAIHGLPFSTHTELLEPEDLVRGLGFSSQICRELGLEFPRDAKMTDVPCHSWFIPTLLRHAGIDFLHLGCNAGSRSPEVPPLFWWEGADGSRVLTMYTAESYGTGLVPPPGWPCKTWLALIHTGDNHGPPQPEEIKKLLAEAAQKLPGIKLRIGRLSDFADAILAEKPTLPVIRADMPDTWIHGPMCDPIGASKARNIRPLIAIAEMLGTQSGQWGIPGNAHAAAVAASYEQSLLYGEHTWGGALGWVVRYSEKTPFAYGEAWKKQRTEGRFKRLEASWAEHTAYIDQAEAIIKPLLEEELEALADNVRVDGPRVVVYNPLPWKRDGLATFKAPLMQLAALKPADGGQAIPVQSDGGRAWFIARDLPPMGYRTYVPATRATEARDLECHEAAQSIENEFLKAVVDPGRGGLCSLIDKRTGHDLVDGTSEEAFGQYRYERFDADQVAAYVKAYVKITADWAITELGKPSLPPAKDVPYRSASPRNCALAFERTETSVAAILDAPPALNVPHGVRLRFLLYAGQPWLDLEVSIKDKPADPWPEAGWLALPVKAAQPVFRLGRQASIIDPARDIVRGANRFIMGVHTGLMIHEQRGSGVAICPLDGPLVSFDTPGCWKYAIDFVPRKPSAYVNLFNNQWTTNFRLWNEGSWTSRVRVWAVDARRGEPDFVTRSLEARYPLQASAADRKRGTLPAERRGIEVSRPGILVSAFGPNPDGPGTILRFWECAGVTGPCDLRLPEELRAQSLRLIDLRGRRTGDALVSRSGGVHLDLHAFSPVTLLLEN
jgi:alpha-mannosidase